MEDKVEAQMTDEVFSPKPPTHGEVAALDQDLRTLYQTSPPSTHCSALATDAFALPLSQRPLKLAKPSTPATSSAMPSPGAPGVLKAAMELHTLAMFFAESMLYLHKAPFAQALIDYPDEPLEAPWSASVLAVILEAGPYMTQITKSWSELDPVLAPRWWHIYFHTFATTVVQSSLVVKCPRSKLVQHALYQITAAIDIFETAAVTGAPVAMLLPRAKSLRTDALRAIQSTRRIPASMRASNGLGVVSPPKLSKEPTDNFNRCILKSEG
ncbi:BQ5605_C006g04020 [Microbotryum silenes-dioicae]|uniref:BQ5605_C006g04020 protein n=1 Tax=Microbotryum silenes-dioicae TaxID=796604 RepID=A0A2X0MZZ5_9BASI|nr:BQ5605_C006g04020 [Microbotryum silenes-dioicae]